MKKSLIIIILTFFYFTALAQKFIQANAVEQYPPSKVFVPDDYNRVSSYLYVINKQKLLDLFKGVEYTKEELKELGIRKDDKPDFLSLSIDIKHPLINSNTAVSIPLFIYDTRTKGSERTFSNFNGMILNDVNAEHLESDIMGQIRIEALTSNASVKFWQSVAKISADFGQSAVSMAMGNAAGIADLKSKLSGYIGQGLKALNNMSDKKLMDYSFFVPLISRSNNNNFDEIITSVKLYQISWSTTTAKATSYFPVMTKSAIPADFETKVINGNKDIPYILVIETRTRTKIDLGQPEFKDDYRNKIANELNEYDKSEWDMFRSYNRNFNTAYDAYNSIRLFRSSLNTKTVLWNALITAIDNSYRFKKAVKDDNSKFLSSNYTQAFQDRYKILQNRYAIVNRMVDELYKGENNVELEKSEVLIRSLMNEKPLTSSNSVLYTEVQNLNGYGSIIKNVDANAIVTNESFNQTKILKDRYENRLFENLTSRIPTAVSDRKRTYNNIVREYPECAKCIIEANAQLLLINQDDLAALKTRYNNLSDEQYNEFKACRLYIQGQFAIISTGLEQKESFEKGMGQRQLENLKNGIKMWQDNISRDTTLARLEDLIVWITNIEEARKIIKENATKLISSSLLKPDSSCNFN